MIRYKATRKLRPEVAAYIAGLIDGEGTITLSHRHANERRQLVVSIANTERPLLEYALLQAGTGKITNKRTVSSKHTASYCYAVTNRQALALLQRLTPRNGKYTTAAGTEQTEFEQKLMAMLPRETTRPGPVR